MERALILISFIPRKLVLLDKEHVVRGYYNGLDSVEMAKLANDMVFVMLEKDKFYVSPVKEMRPILPAHYFYSGRNSRSW